MAKAKASITKTKANFGRRKSGKHSKAKNKQPKKHRGQGR